MKIYLVVFVAAVFSALNIYAQEKKQSLVDILFETVESHGTEAAVEKYHDLKKKNADEYKFDLGALDALGDRLMSQKQMHEALVFLKLNVDMFTENPIVHHNLGECYLKIGERALAIQSYKTALEALSNQKIDERRKKAFRQTINSKFYLVENFVPHSESTFNYIAFFGGAPAGLWDMENLVGFRSSNPGTEISYDSNNLYFSPVPTAAPAKFDAKLMGDLTTSFIGGVYRKHIMNGDIADISAIWAEEGWDRQFPESFKLMASYEGRQYFVPQAFQFNPIWYRKDIFEAHGWRPPQTWDALLLLCDKIRAAGYAPFTIGAADWPPPVARWFTILNLRLNGPEFHEQVMLGNIVYTDPRIKDVFNHWHQLFEHHAFDDSSGWNTYGKGLRDIITGKALMYNLGEWIFESVPDSTAEVLDFFPIPVINPEVTSAEIVHAYGAFVHAKAKNAAVAKTLLRYLGSVESQTSNTKQLKRLNANTGIDRGLYTDVQKRLFDHVKKTEVLVPLFEFNTTAKLAQAGLETFVAFWRKPENVEQILKDWEAKRVQLITAK